MVAYVIEESCASLSARERAQIKTSSFEAFGLVTAQLKECAIDKRSESRLRASLDQSDLEAMGKVLSDQERVHLCEKIELYLSKPTPATLTKDHAFAFQAHLCTYLLVSNVLPVVIKWCFLCFCIFRLVLFSFYVFRMISPCIQLSPVMQVRQEILCSLKLGKTLKYEETKMQYVIDSPPVGKIKAPLFVLVPRSETPLLRRYCICSFVLCFLSFCSCRFIFRLSIHHVRVVGGM